jgi:hypothetical protein
MSFIRLAVQRNMNRCNAALGTESRGRMCGRRIRAFYPSHIHRGGAVNEF